MDLVLAGVCLAAVAVLIIRSRARAVRPSRQPTEEDRAVVLLAAAVDRAAALRLLRQRTGCGLVEAWHTLAAWEISRDG